MLSRFYFFIAELPLFSYLLGLYSALPGGKRSLASILLLGELAGEGWLEESRARPREVSLARELVSASALYWPSEDKKKEESSATIFGAPSTDFS